MHSADIAQARRHNILAVMSTVAIAGLGFGLSMPLLSILLERAGYSSALIGLNTAMQAIAGLAVLPLTPRALAKFGAARLLMLCLFVIALSLIAMRAVIDIWAWFPLRFLFGGALAVMFTTSEFWVNAIAEERSRGRLIAFYAMALSSGWILGPLILGMLGVEGWSPILGAVGILALAVIPLWLGAAQAPAPEPGMRADLLGVVKEAPVAALAPFIFGAVEIGIFALLPVYAMRQGLSAQQSTYMLTALATGGIALQYPLGWLADRVDRHRILLLCALAGLLGAVSLPLFIHRLPWLLASLVLWGGCVGGLYTVGLTLIGQLFKGPRLAAANTSVVLLYSLGGLIAPAVSGLAMDHWPHTGLALVLGVLCGSYALLTVSMPRRRPESA